MSPNVVMKVIIRILLALNGLVWGGLCLMGVLILLKAGFEKQGP